MDQNRPTAPHWCLLAPTDEFRAATERVQDPGYILAVHDRERSSLAALAPAGRREGAYALFGRPVGRTIAPTPGVATAGVPGFPGSDRRRRRCILPSYARRLTRRNHRLRRLGRRPRAPHAHQLRRLRARAEPGSRTSSPNLGQTEGNHPTGAFRHEPQHASRPDRGAAEAISAHLGTHGQPKQVPDDDR